MIKKFWRRIWKNRSDVVGTPIDIQEGYKLWADNYPPMAHNPLMVLDEEAMLTLLPVVVGKKCLDLACGSGRYGRILQEQGASQVVGTDGTFAMLAEAKRHLPDFGVAHAPFFPLPFGDGVFDVITCGLSVGHELNLRAILGEATRVLKRGGVLLYSDFHPFLALQGFQRTFTGANGQVFALTHFVHLYGDHVQACAEVGLNITGVAEPIYQKDGAVAVKKMPAVLVIRAEKK
jgi:malonyl-CoA O-methyltransferase